jgi:hypothetical protein
LAPYPYSDVCTVSKFMVRSYLINKYLISIFCYNSVLMKGNVPINHCEGLVPLVPIPVEPAPEVAVLLMRGWVRRKS